MSILAQSSDQSAKSPLASLSPSANGADAGTSGHAAFFMAQATVAGVEKYLKAAQDVILPEILRYDLDLEPGGKAHREFMTTFISFDAYRTMVALWKESAFVDEAVRKQLSLTKPQGDATFTVPDLASRLVQHWDRAEEAGEDLKVWLQRTFVMPLSRAGYVERVVNSDMAMGKSGAPQNPTQLRMTEKFHRFMVSLHSPA
ncbi:MAG: hypothetical protein ACFB6R_06560 [Alphaproteobacteria bacterium]